jgi:hypothetical protein
MVIKTDFEKYENIFALSREERERERERERQRERKGDSLKHIFCF